MGMAIIIIFIYMISNEKMEGIVIILNVAIIFYIQFLETNHFDEMRQK